MTRQARLPLRRRIVLATLPALAVAAGCSSIIPPAPEITSYQLSPKSTFPPNLPRVGGVLLIETPTAAPGLGSARIALVRQANQLEYYAGADWVDVLPTLVRTRLVQSFDNSRAIDATSGRAAGPIPDYRLVVNIRHFEAVYGSLADGPDTWVALDVRLLGDRREMISRNTFEARVPVGDPRLGEIMLSFDEAFGSVAKDIVVWTMNEIADRGRTARV